MTDALMTRAVREELAAIARKHVKLWHVPLIACAAAIFYVAVTRDSHWFWWIAGIPTVIYSLLLLGWIVAWWWVPRTAARRLAHLPHRRVSVEVADPRLVFQTATERLEVTWEELTALRRLPSFWLFCLRAGARIPVPSSLLSQEAAATFRSRLAADRAK
jgi:hypothetical protein